MSLTDVVSGAGLSLFPKIALWLFLLAFVAVLVRSVFLHKRCDVDRLARMALDDDDRVADTGKEGPR